MDDEYWIPLPQFYDDGRESFPLWTRRYEFIQQARYKDSGEDMNRVLAAELPTVLPLNLFIVWDNLPLEVQSSYTETKKHLHEHLLLQQAVNHLTATVRDLNKDVTSLP